MKRLDTGEMVADEEFIIEENRKNAMINEVLNRLRARDLFDKIAGLGYGEKDWELLFYGEATQEAIDIASNIIGIKLTSLKM